MEREREREREDKALLHLLTGQHSLANGEIINEIIVGTRHGPWSACMLFYTHTQCERVHVIVRLPLSMRITQHAVRSREGIIFNRGVGLALEK